ncbi:hypothetical protein Bca4012_054697 [Brassica carinata]|uniref:NmrA-like domain-containing protein n=1 Tax=Brassica carinata TaxID=52824 RepID=A0A8X7VXT9_BRACI|nr:hypothetical protein Bca52824_012253 [Brassica carinata]
MANKSSILFIGGTGYIGKYIVEASARSGHPTLVLVRNSTLTSPSRSTTIDNFKNLGVRFLLGDLNDHTSLVNSIKQADVVISTVGHSLLGQQDKILSAIKEAGNVKRFFPSEFGNDVDRAESVEPAKSAYATKAMFRRRIEAEGIPYTIVSCNFFAGYFLPTLAQPGATSPPRDKVIIMGDGTPKAVFNKEEDIGTYTIKAVDDPRTLNKILYVRPPMNTYSFNDLVSLWEKKIGKTLERIHVPEEEILNQIREASPPLNVLLSLCHCVFVKGGQTNFEIEPSFGVEASELYPDVKYTTVDEILDNYV